MRYGLIGLAMALFLVAAGAAQDTKGKGKGKEDKDPKTPTYKEPTEVFGKKFEVWRKDIKSDDPSKAEMAMKNVTEFGPNKAQLAIPDILAELKKHSKKSPLEVGVRVNGVMALSTIFGQLKAIKKEPDPKQVENAANIYRAFLKEDEVMLLMPTLQGVKLLQSLQWLKSDTRKVLIGDVLPRVAHRGSWEVRKEAVQTLAMLAKDEKGDFDPRALDAFRYAMMEDKSNQVRYVGIQAAAMIGGPDVLKDLRKLRKAEPSLPVRIMAYQGIVVVGKAAALPDLRDAMFGKDPTAQVRAAVVGMFPLADQNNPLPALVDVRRALGDDAKEVRLQALNTIAQYKPLLDKNPKELGITTAKLRTFLKSEPDKIVSMWGHATYMSLTTCSKDHIDPIVKRLTDKDQRVRLNAHQILRLCGKNAKTDALKPVLKVAHDPDPALAVPAIETLVPMRADEAIPELEKLWKDAKVHQAIRETAEDAITALRDLDTLDKAKAKEKAAPKTPAGK